MRSFIALNRGVCSRRDIKADTVAFYYIEPHGALWPCTAYAMANNDGDLLPALNIIPLDTGDEMAPPLHPWYHPHRNTRHQNPDLQEDIIKMMGPTVGQLEHYVVDAVPQTQQNILTPTSQSQSPTLRKGAPRSPPPDAPAPHIMVKKEQVAEVPEPSVDDPNVSTSLGLTQPDIEEGTASDTTFNESVDSGAPPAAPCDHTYTSVGISAPDSTNNSTQLPSSSTGGPLPPVPLGASFPNCRHPGG